VKWDYRNNPISHNIQIRKYDKLGGIVFGALGGGIKCRVELSFGPSLKKIKDD